MPNTRFTRMALGFIQDLINVIGLTLIFGLIFDHWLIIGSAMGTIFIYMMFSPNWSLERNGSRPHGLEIPAWIMMLPLLIGGGVLIYSRWYDGHPTATLLGIVGLGWFALAIIVQIMISRLYWEHRSMYVLRQHI